jgi:hypothetical protein
MMEGPQTFNTRAGGLSGRLLQLAQAADVRKGTVEERNRDLAEAIHKAIAGDSRILVNFSEQATNTEKRTSYKTDFQAQSEKEVRAFKKRIEEEKKGSALVVNERLFDSFDGSLPPAKLVDSATQSHKKKFAKEELDSFVSAAVETGKLADVCGLLEAYLRDGRQALQNRFKVLTIVEAMLALPEAAVFFKAHSAGIVRHLTVDRADNPAKSQAAQQVAQAILQTLQGTPAQLPPTPAAAARARGASATSSSQPRVTTATVVAQPQQQQSAAAGGASQWEWTPAPSLSGSGMPSYGGKPVTPSFDDMFANLSVKAPQPAVPQQQQQQLQPQQQAFAWAAPATRAQAPAVHASSQQSPPSFFVTSPPITAVPNNSFATPDPMPAGPPMQQASEAQQSLILQQMAELQRNMAMMMQFVQQPQPQAVPAPQPQAVPAPAPVQQPSPALAYSQPPPAVQAPAYVQEEPQPPSQPLPSVSEREPSASPAAMGLGSAAAIQPSNSSDPPPQAPSSDSGRAESMAMLMQLQQQMIATQQMLAQQQAAFEMLQAKLMGGSK